MAQLPPDWTFKMYSKLWKHFGEKSFSNKEAKRIIKDDNLTQAISRLKKDGWVKINIDQEDGRKSTYTLNNPEITLKTIIEDNAK